MANKLAVKPFEESLGWLRTHGFQVEDAAQGTQVAKYGCVATLARNTEGAGRITAYPSVVVGGEASLLVDHGYQKLLQTPKLTVAATADHLHALHSFTEELKEALGMTSLYNESLGSVNESCHYDRVKDRDLPEAQKHKPAWE